MFEQLGDGGRRVMVAAVTEAGGLGHTQVGTEHLLLGLLAVPTGPVHEAFAAMGLDLLTVRRELSPSVRPAAPGTPGLRPLTPRLRSVMERSMRRAERAGDPAGPEHLLLGLLGDAGGAGIQVLRWLGVDPSQLEELIRPAIPPTQPTPPTPAAETGPPASEPPPGLAQAADGAAGEWGTDGGAVVDRGGVPVATETSADARGDPGVEPAIGARSARGGASTDEVGSDRPILVGAAAGVPQVVVDVREPEVGRVLLRDGPAAARCPGCGATLDGHSGLRLVEPAVGTRRGRRRKLPLLRCRSCGAMATFAGL